MSHSVNYSFETEDILAKISLSLSAYLNLF